MKKIILILAILAIMIFGVLFIGQGGFFLHSNIENSQSNTGNQQEDGGPSQNENESEKDIKTDTGIFQGQIDNNFIEIAISGVPKENATRVFMLSDEVRDEFLDMQLSTGDVIKFQYFLNEDDQNIIVEIMALNSGN